jgi:hypothetical protein
METIVEQEKRVTMNNEILANLEKQRAELDAKIAKVRKGVAVRYYRYGDSVFAIINQTDNICCRENHLTLSEGYGFALAGADEISRAEFDAIFMPKLRKITEAMGIENDDKIYIEQLKLRERDLLAELDFANYRAGVAHAGRLARNPSFLEKQEVVGLGSAGYFYYADLILNEHNDWTDFVRIQKCWKELQDVTDDMRVLSAVIQSGDKDWAGDYRNALLQHRALCAEVYEVAKKWDTERRAKLKDFNKSEMLEQARREMLGKVYGGK